MSTPDTRSSQRKRTVKEDPDIETPSKRLRARTNVDYRLVKPEEALDELDGDVKLKEEKPDVKVKIEVVKKQEEVKKQEDEVKLDADEIIYIGSKRIVLECVMILLGPRHTHHSVIVDNQASESEDEDEDIDGQNNDGDFRLMQGEDDDDDEFQVDPDFIPVPVYAERSPSVESELGLPYTGIGKGKGKGNSKGKSKAIDKDKGNDQDSVKPRPFVDTPLRPIYIKGSGLTIKDKDEIAATLGDLELVDVPGINKKMYMSRKHLEQYFYWCAERQKIFEKRERGEPGPWTTDDLFYAKTSNVFRHEDRSSQFLIKHVIDGYKCEPPLPDDNPDSDPRWKDGKWVDTVEEACWRVMVFWQFGKMETWDVLRKGLPRGDVRWATYKETTYTKILGDAVKTGFKLFTGSYQIHPSQNYKGKFNYVNAMRSISHLMKEGIPKIYSTTTSLQEAWNKIQSYWGIGHYHGIQLTLHLNYIPGIALSTTDWICNGRGAKNGLFLILPELSIQDKEQLKGMKWLMSQQWAQWKRLGFTPMSGFSNAGLSAPVPGVNLVDIENSLCLWQKYQRDHRKRELAERRGETVARKKDKSGLRVGASIQITVLPRKFQVKLEAAEAEDFVELGRGAFGDDTRIEEVQVKLEDGVVKMEEEIEDVTPSMINAETSESGSGSGTVSRGVDLVDENIPGTSASSVSSSAPDMDVEPALDPTIPSKGKGQETAMPLSIIDVDDWDVIVID